MAHDIGNGFASGQTLPRLAGERRLVHEPAAEWTYSHHPHLAFFKGRYHLIWSSGRVNEDDLGQRVLTASSADFRTWTAPRVLADSQTGTTSERVLTAAGLYASSAGLAAYIGQYEYDSASLVEGVRPRGDARHCHTGCQIWLTPDGESWRPIGAVGLPIVPNHGPQAIAGGRLILVGNVMFPFTDDPTGLTGWRAAGLFPPELAAEVVDDSEGFQTLQARLGWPVSLCEGAFYQTGDGRLHMLLRCGTGRRLWLSESSDRGQTWSPPRPTEFTDNQAKFHFGRLPDGRHYYVGNPDADPHWGRHRLVLSLSEDGCRFDRHFVIADEPFTMKRPGLHKGGQYGYPHSLVHDGALLVACTRQKEAVEVFRIKLAELD